MHVRHSYKHYLPELMIYIAVWVIVFLAPVVGNFFDLLSGKATSMYWGGIFVLWLDILPFFLLFLLNERVLLSRLFLRQKVALYVVSIIVASVVVFSAWGAFSTMRFFREREIELRMRKFPDSREHLGPRKYSGPGEHLFSDNPPVMMNSRVQEKNPEARFPDSIDQKKLKRIGFPHPPFGRDMPFFLILFRGPFFGRMLIALLMFSFNIAVKLFFKSLRDQELMKEMERNKLQSELDYLKYQINPHFFMNTLNNIHALVDLDTEKAKQTIVELSRLMRYVLYESNNRTILLSKEVQFLQHYVELMRIRYTHKVRVDISMPQDTGNMQVPPLLFISFVENAFKHGISYQRPSFVAVDMHLENDKVVFHCSNSNFGNSDDQHHGIGLENIRKRLHLLFEDHYSLSIKETTECFDVLLSVPVVA